ncbi:MAG TPA: dihydrofolate reductase family protein [Ignavibacteria bacterium]|jgi:dihydrofolate reductase
MRKVMLSTHMTLDGFMAGPNKELDWHFENWNDDMERYISEQKNDIDTILVGRVTYQSMAKHWPAVAEDQLARKNDIEFANWMNRLPKVVFSRTLSAVEWNNSRLVKHNISEEISKMKRQTGKDMILWGGVGIVSTFIQLGLIDEYQIWIAPVILGSGMPLFKNVKCRLDLKLLETNSFSNGVILLSYRIKHL